MTEEITRRLSHIIYYGSENCLLGKPKPLSSQAEPTAIFHKEWKTIEPEYSVVVPVHNMERIIVRNLKSIAEFTTGLFEIILILDSCTDKSKEKLMEYALSIVPAPNLVSLTIIEQTTPVFETTCDNMGFVLSRGTYIVEIQADMHMTEHGYNYTLSLAMRQYDDVIAVSGRCCHTFLNQHRELIGVGKIGNLIDDPSYQLPERKFYIRGTCNRGPLLLHREKLIEMQYLDETNFALGNDDHDLFARAYYQRGYVCGHIPIDFLSPQRDGATRQPRPQSESDALAVRLARSNGGFLQSISAFPLPAFQNRQLNALKFTYGSVDVTTLARNAFMQNGKIHIAQSASFNSLFTDVAPNVVKFLKIEDGDFTLTVPETRLKSYTVEF